MKKLHKGVKKQNAFDLSKLDRLVPEGTKVDMAEIDRKLNEEIQRFKDKYGDDWRYHYRVYKGDIVDYDRNNKTVNTAIYRSGLLFVSGYFGISFEDLLEKRKREVLGEQYDRLSFHKGPHPEVNELLIQDAIRTGKWKELPDELQDEYHERMGSKVNV